VDDLERVRWQLDRLASARLLGPLNPELEAEYETLADREYVLMLAGSCVAEPAPSAAQETCPVP